MIQRPPGHDPQREPSETAHDGDSLPLHEADETEVALFMIPGSPGARSRVVDVRGAHRLMLPDLDLNASPDLQALATSLKKEVPVLQSVDGALEQFDDETAMVDAANEEASPAEPAEDLALDRDPSEGNAWHALSRHGRLPARLVGHVRQAYAATSVDDVIRFASLVAAIVLIATVMARFDWSRLSTGPATPDSPSAPALRADAFAGDALGRLAHLAPRVDHAPPGASDMQPLAEAADARAPRSGRGVDDEPVRHESVVPAAPGRDAIALPVELAGGPARLPDGVEALAVIDNRVPGALLAAAAAAPSPSIPAEWMPLSDTPVPPVFDPLRVAPASVEASDIVPGRSAPAIAPIEADAITAALSQLRLAYERRDANLARVVWPTVDGRALARAFDSLRSQSVEFDQCSIEVVGGTGQVECRGRTTYVPLVGSQVARTESRQWMFTLEKGSDRWVITKAAAR